MKIIISLCFLTFNYVIYADVLPEAKSEVKITLAKKPTTRPMTVAFIPGQKKILHRRWWPSSLRL